MKGITNQPTHNYIRALLKLSRREGKILLLVGEGRTNKEIAEELYLSVRTVENHRYHICKKIGLKEKGALKRWAKDFFH